MFAVGSRCPSANMPSSMPRIRLRRHCPTTGVSRWACISGIRPDQSIGFVGFEVFFGEDDNAAGESVAEGVDAGTGFAFGGAGAGRFLAFARLAAIWASDVGVMVWLLAMGIACGWGGIGGGKE
jgi:hypothetical protein